MGTFNPSFSRSELYSSLGLDTKSSSSSPSAENASAPQVLSLLASALEKTIRKNKKFIRRSRMKDRATIFHGSRAPALSIREYIERIFKYSRCSNSCFVTAYVYMNWFLEETNGFLASLNAHRLLVACVLVAAKFLDDVTYNNAYYAKIGGVSTAEMNRLELQLLFTLNFRLYVTVETFDHYCLLLIKASTKSKSKNRSHPIEWPIQSCALRGVCICPT